MIQQNTSKRIAIIGAGLGGLCLAQGLKKNGLNATVFEKDASLNARTQGYRIRINEPGRKSFEKCLPQNLYQLFINTCAASSSGMNVLTTSLESSKNDLVESWSDGIKEIPDLKPNRLTLREILLHGLEENISFGKELTDWIELDNHQVKLVFADGTTYTADLVIAADGVHSKIGKEYCKDQKINTGNITIYGRTFFSAEALETISPELLKGTSVILNKKYSLIIDAMVFNVSKNDASLDMISPVSDYFYWAFIGNPEAFSLLQGDFYNYSGEEILHSIRKLTRNWHPQLKALFDYADHKSLSITPIRSSLPKEPWPSGNMTALGDAVHTMSPAGGVGANTAFMDAALLAENIMSKSSFSAAIADYEDKMRLYSNRAVEISLQGGEILHGNNEKND
ncbi:NAD(P)/FAD-dependent oxidoreductase [uncultured Chryseobacterium sp.]|uniref:FAD-dependent oxidoreductase n=1 Tax=uncultured Chryseobacterium sp. TaxID=259322 RepID=UPI0025FDF92E|nr:NAD(P)/FAD-dependent oxidoreductase [uncultured Chryseobacterium sp.]